MTPDDLTTVARSWRDLRARRAPMLAALAERLGTDDGAEWLYGAVEELVGLLPAPSQLAARARVVGETWPDPGTAPSFRVEGRAWLAAGEACAPAWSERTEAAWQQAWLLLSEVLASEALSPFADGAASVRPGA